MIIELSAMPQTVTEAFVKSLYAFMLVSIKEGKASSEVTNGLRKWGPAATPLINRFGLKKFVPLFKQVTKNEEAPDDDTLREFGKEIKGAFIALNKEHDIEHWQLDLIKSAGLWMRTGSEGAYRKMEKSVGQLKDSTLSKEFTKEVGSQKPFAKALSKLVKALTGKEGLIIPYDQIEAAEKKNAKLYEEYKKHVKQFNLVVKDALNQYVRASGKSTVDFQEAKKALESQGIKTNWQEGFSGRIDDQGKWYTSAGLQLTGVPSSIVFPYIYMNPKYDPKKDNGYVFLARKRPKGVGTPGGQSVFTISYRQGATTQKFGNVDELKDKIKAIRNKWLVPLHKGVGYPEGVISTILEILIQFSARVGSSPNKPNGISALRVNNFQFQPNGNVLIKYMGKDNVAQKHQLEKTNKFHKMVIVNLNGLKQDKKPIDKMFTFKKSSGKQVHINSTIVNKFFQKLGAGDMTVHKLRTLRGTLLFKELMDKNATKLFNPKKPLTEKEAKAKFMSLAEEVGKVLGHIRTMKDGPKVTGATALASYIDPAVQVEFWTKLNMRPPKALMKYMPKKDPKD